MWYVATEDELSEAVAVRMLREEYGKNVTMKCIRKGGFGYLMKNIDSFCNISKRNPVLMLADLDKIKCAPILIRKWFGANPQPVGFRFRVVVREIEAWLLADRDAVARLLKISTNKIDNEPEKLDDAKRYLLELAAKAPLELRHELLPVRGSAASQGFGYNGRLVKFVNELWSPRRASTSSDSLKSAIGRIKAQRNLQTG